MSTYDDPSLPFIIQPDNISRYEDGNVLILDRRVYPFEVRFERCRTYEETATAIENMVTQSEGPGFATGHGMVQAGREARGKSAAAAEEILERAGSRLLGTRPTHNQIRLVVGKLLEVGREALNAGEELEDALLEATNTLTLERYERYRMVGEAGASLLKDGDVVLTHCWAEGGIILTLLEALRQGKNLEAICTETRPYLQGARLTADGIAEMGITTTVVNDGTPGYLMAEGSVSVFMTGADRVTMSGHVINKTGTLPIALTARHFGVPYYAFSAGPDPEAPTPDQVVIEERDPEESLHCLGQRTATYRAQGRYPAFDITPPEAVTGIVTRRGVFSPDSLTTDPESAFGY